MRLNCLDLEADDVRGPAHWYWRLKDCNGLTLATHEVRLDPGDWQYQAFLDVHDYLVQHVPSDKWETESARLAEEVGRWIGERVLGTVGDAILAHGTPVTVRVLIPSAPKAVAGLQYLPLELAYVGNEPLALQDVSLVFTAPGEFTSVSRMPVGQRLRMLAIFSLPTSVHPLNLRHERQQLRELVHSVARRKNIAIELRILQYGVTRSALKDILQQQGGWDIIHISGHGGEAMLVLEKPDGTTDLVSSGELLELLRAGRSRLKWITLSACLSAARTAEETLMWLGLAPNRAVDVAAKGVSKSPLSAVANALVRELGCAILAMRFPVSDEFAINLGVKLYRGVLEDGLSLTRALQLALPEVSASLIEASTPTLLGQMAVELELKAPLDDSRNRAKPFAAGLSGFEPAPKRFIGRVGIMTQASAALAGQSGFTGVLFHGMAGAGKTSCALELAYLYEDLQRFTGFLWYKAPRDGSEWADELMRFAQAFETQVSDQHMEPLFPLVHMMAESDLKFDAYLSRLQKFLEHHSIMLVLDNLETLLRSDGRWHEPRWGRLLTALLTHPGDSRVVLTSRTIPVIPNLAPGKLRELSIHSLSLVESALLARQLPNLGRLLRGERASGDEEIREHRDLVKRTLLVVQGHPKLLELAEGQAADPLVLAGYLDRASTHWGRNSDVASRLQAFFQDGESKVDAGALLQALSDWTSNIVVLLPEGSRTLFQFLCGMEEEDRLDSVVLSTWTSFLQRLAREGAAPRLEESLGPLVSSGLVGIRVVGSEAASVERQGYAIHPGVAEASRVAAGKEFQAAVDNELAAFFVCSLRQGLQQESVGAGAMVIHASRRAAPYLIRQQRWMNAIDVLAEVIQRDHSPSTTATLLPMFRHLVAVLDGKEGEILAACGLAHALAIAGHKEEAEGILRSRLDQAEAKEDFGLAALASEGLINLLRVTGRPEQALALLERAENYPRPVELRPSLRIVNGTLRLSLLNDLGRYEDVLKEFEILRKESLNVQESLPQSQTVGLCRAHESILENGAFAAMRTNRWMRALDLIDEIVASKKSRGATELDLACIKFNRFSPLMRLERYDDAETVLVNCRTILESAKALPELGRWFGARAELEKVRGHSDRAVAHGQTALRYYYQTGQPLDCAKGHFNLSLYLKYDERNLRSALAHRMASAVIRLQTGDGYIVESIQGLSRDLAALALTSERLLTSFAELCQIVDQVAGVRFARLFARLPTTRAATGDEAVREVIRRARSIPASSLPEVFKILSKLDQAALAGPEKLAAVFDALRQKPVKDHPRQDRPLDAPPVELNSERKALPET
jgi:tetratricopeptide (TPR) repeat protein